MTFIVVAFTVILGYGALAQGAVTVSDGMWTAGAVGVLASLYYGLVAGRGMPPRSGLVLGLCGALAAWVAFQMAPLPGWAIQGLSEHREKIAAAVDGGRWAAITVVPAETRLGLVRLGAVLLAMLVARDLAWRYPEASGYLTGPVLAVGVGEAALGMVQFFGAVGAGRGEAAARGTYVNRDHFAGLLEMGLPLAVMCGVGVYQRGKKRFETSGVSAVLACGLFGAGAAMLMAVVFSASRMGFLAALFSLLFIGTVASSGAISRRLDARLRWLPVGLISVAIAVTFVYLPTDELIARFAQAGNETLTADTRVLIWKETGELVKAGPWAGFGLGSYESAFYAFKRVAPMLSVGHAHNDYLQGVAELGLVGMIPVLLLGGLAVKGALESAGMAPETMQHYVGIGCAGSLFALGLHSLVDFNMYIPANALAMAWIAGIAMAGNSLKAGRG